MLDEWEVGFPLTDREASSKDHIHAQQLYLFVYNEFERKRKRLLEVYHKHKSKSLFFMILKSICGN